MKSRKLFDRYAKNLEEVRSYYKISMYNNKTHEHIPYGYLCPITFNFYDHPRYKELSGEHVPQKKIGGDVICLTDKHWNNDFGKIDNYVIERGNELGFQKTTGKINAKAYINGQLKSKVVIDLTDGRSKFSFIGGGFTDDNPHMQALIKGFEMNEEMKLKLTPLGQLSRQAKIGYLKNAYLLAFSKFAYTMLFGPKGSIAMFHYIRRQLRSPEDEIFKKLPFVFELNDKSGLDGIYVIETNGIRTIGVFFKISTENVNRAAIIFPPLDLSITEAEKWSTKGEDITFARINMERKFVPFQEVINIENAKYNDLEYETES